MALKGDRHILQSDISLICNDVATAGVILMKGTAGSGNALDANAGVATLATSPSGMVPAGLLLNNFVNVDQTRYHRNFHNQEQVIGEKAALLRKGWVVTNNISGTPAVGNTAFVGASGVITPTVSATGGLKATPPVGQFDSILDEDGYCKVSIELPHPVTSGTLSS